MIVIFIALAITLCAAVYDIRTGTIPDWLTYGGMALGIVLHVSLEYASGGRGDALIIAATDASLGAGVCGVLPLIAVAKGKLGRGDLKLFLALGALLGPVVGIEAQIYAIMAAFVAAPVFAWKKGRLGAALRDVARQVRKVFRRKDAEAAAESAHDPTWMPLAPAILAGVVITAIGSWR